MDKLKIGILTFYYAHNYGAVLQAYALKKVLEDLGQDVKLVEYRNQAVDARYDRTLKIRFSIKDMKHPVNLINKIRQSFSVKYQQPYWETQYDEFEEFIEKFLVKSKQFSMVDFNEYDVLITGSDQVWDLSLTGGIDNAYFLNIPYKGVRASYAASNKKGYFTSEEAKCVNKYLHRFDYISTRESSFSEYIRESMGLNCVTVLDPTLLLKESDYNEIEYKGTIESEKYILVYSVIEDSKLMQIAKRLSSVLNVKLIEISYFYKRQFPKHEQIADIGPDKFLFYIKNAYLVFTNSFHGTIFSILYKRNFYTMYKTNSRIDNLLCQLKLCSRHIKDFDNIDMENSTINYNQVDNMLTEFRNESMRYLYQFIPIYNERK